MTKTWIWSPGVSDEAVQPTGVLMGDTGEVLTMTPTEPASKVAPPPVALCPVGQETFAVWVPIALWAVTFVAPGAPAGPAGPAGPRSPVAPRAPAAPAGPAGPRSPRGPRGSCPALKSLLSNERGFTLGDVTAFALSCAVPTLLRGMRSWAYAPPPSASSSAMNATTIAGDGRCDVMCRMMTSFGGVAGAR